MMDLMTRVDNRKNDELRKLAVTYNVFPYASGSTLFEIGNTKVLCAITLQQGVPHFLRGKRKGWLTAEYSLMPASTPIRTIREVTSNKRSGRNIEISRLIGRCLRAITNLELLGEQTIFVDCDVLQADGGTRSACIIGAYLALKSAVNQWLGRKILTKDILIDELAAISVGISGDLPVLDLNFVEDNATDADFNFILTRSGKIVEIQGSAESHPINWGNYNYMQDLAIKGAQSLYEFYDQNSCYKSKEEKKLHSNIFSYAKQHFFSK